MRMAFKIVPDAEPNADGRWIEVDVEPKTCRSWIQVEQAYGHVAPAGHRIVAVRSCEARAE